MCERMKLENVQDIDFYFLVASDTLLNSHTENISFPSARAKECQKRKILGGCEAEKFEICLSICLAALRLFLKVSCFRAPPAACSCGYFLMFEREILDFLTVFEWSGVAGGLKRFAWIDDVNVE